LQQDGALESEYEGVNAGKDLVFLLIFGIRGAERKIVNSFFRTLHLDHWLADVMNGVDGFGLWCNICDKWNCFTVI